MTHSSTKSITQRQIKLLICPEASNNCYMNSVVSVHFYTKIFLFGDDTCARINTQWTSYIYSFALFVYLMTVYPINPLNAELSPICHLLALLGSTTIIVVSRLRVKV